jgi:hypothetical protein
VLLRHGSPDLQPIGLEWVGDALFITTVNGLHRVNFPDEPLVFGAVQYALSGVPSGHVLGGLAYDPRATRSIWRLPTATARRCGACN